MRHIRFNQQKTPPSPFRRNTLQTVLQRLDAAVQNTAGHSNAETIAWMRKAMFGDVDALQKSGTIVLPE